MHVMVLQKYYTLKMKKLRNNIIYDFKKKSKNNLTYAKINNLCQTISATIIDVTEKLYSYIMYKNVQKKRYGKSTTQKIRYSEKALKFFNLVLKCLFLS